MQNETTYTCIDRPCSAMADVKNEHELNGLQAAAIFMSIVFIALALFYICAKRLIAIKSAKDQHHTVVMRNATVERFVLEMAEEKPIRFTAEQLAGYTRNYSVRLGAGGFGTVYRGALPNGLAVAVKVLHPGLDTRSSGEQFMAEMGTIGRTHHINLVRLYGFCFDADATRALVYEFMENGSLDDYLSGSVSMPTVAAIATGVARGLRYLHEECQHKIVHYDIKPGNVLLDAVLTPKVADFGLARLVNRADTHVSLSCGRGTPGYAAPEVWTELRITEKCDVYSFGMLLLKIVEHGSNHDADASRPVLMCSRLATARPARLSSTASDLVFAITNVYAPADHSRIRMLELWLPPSPIRQGGHGPGRSGPGPSRRLDRPPADRTEQASGPVSRDRTVANEARARPNGPANNHVCRCIPVQRRGGRATCASDVTKWTTCTSTDVREKLANNCNFSENNKLFHTPKICHYCRELLKYPNALKLDTNIDITHSIIFHHKKLESFEFF